MFLRGITVLLRKCHFQMVSGDQTSLCGCADLTYRYNSSGSTVQKCLKSSFDTRKIIEKLDLKTWTLSTNRFFYRDKNWLKRRQRDLANPRRERPSAHQEGAGSEARKQNSRSQVPRVFGIDTKRAKTGMESMHTRCIPIYCFVKCLSSYSCRNSSSKKNFQICFWIFLSRKKSEKKSRIFGIS